MDMYNDPELRQYHYFCYIPEGFRARRLTDREARICDYLANHPAREITLTPDQLSNYINSGYY